MHPREWRKPKIHVLQNPSLTCISKAKAPVDLDFHATNGDNRACMGIRSWFLGMRGKKASRASKLLEIQLLYELLYVKSYIP